MSKLSQEKINEINFSEQIPKIKWLKIRKRVGGKTENEK